MMPRPLVILVTSVSSVGHVNACAGATAPLLGRGHRVIFVLEESFRGKYSPLGFEEFIYQKKNSTPQEEDKENQTKENPGEKWARQIKEAKILGPESPEEKMENLGKFLNSPQIRQDLVGFDQAVKVAIEKFKPDVVWVDFGTLPPIVHKLGLPWIKNESFTPIFNQFDEDLPPGGSGYPSNGSRSAWPSFNALRRKIARSPSLNDIFESLGYDRYPDDLKTIDTQILTVYAYPEELNYPAIRSKGWFNLEVFQKMPEKREVIQLDQLIPVDFVKDDLCGKWSGKWIYLSMGSMGSIEIGLMKKLVETLGKTAHKFVVSKGHLHEQFDLARNMWGGRYLPQVALLPHMDLVITHGGNNTVTETFIEGKPMVVLPLFVDQFDNAQRLEETGLGARVDAYHYKDEELSGAVERLLGDKELQVRLQVAAKRILGSDRHEMLADKVEQMLC